MDASPQARIEELEGRLARALELLSRAEHLDVLARVGLGGVHEFRNVLTGLQGHARLLLEDKPIGDPDRDSLLRITRGSARAVELLSSFQHLASRPDGERRRIDVGEAVEAVDPALRTILGEWVALDVDILEPARVEIDPIELRSLLLGLCIHAQDRLAGGGMVRLAVERDRRVSDEGDVSRWAVVTLADTGDPLTERDIAFAVDPLGSELPDGPGMGMGLYTARRIARSVGGRIDVDPNDCSCLRVYLPLADAGSASSGGDSETKAGEEAAPRILVVDDDDAVREVAVKILQRLGYRVERAESAEDALDRLAGMAEAPDLLLTDIVMPGLNGRQLADRFSEEHPSTPVLFMSAYTEDEVILHGVRVSEVNFLSKPFTLEGLADAVKSALEMRTR